MKTPRKFYGMYTWAMLSQLPRSIQVRLVDTEGNLVAEGPIAKAILKRNYTVTRQGRRYVFHESSGARDPECITMMETPHEYVVKW